METCHSEVPKQVHLQAVKEHFLACVVAGPKVSNMHGLQLFPVNISEIPPGREAADWLGSSRAERSEDRKHGNYLAPGHASAGLGAVTSFTVIEVLLPVPRPLPCAMAAPGSPLTSCQHLALYYLAEHLEALLEFPRAHVTGQISDVHHTAFTLLKEDREGTPVIILRESLSKPGWAATLLESQREDRERQPLHQRTCPCWSRDH